MRRDLRREGGNAAAYWRNANRLLTDRQQLLDSAYEHDAEVQPPRSRTAARADPRRRQRAVRRARLRRGLGRGHRERRRRHPRARAPLLRRPQGGLHRAARAARRPARGTNCGRPSVAALARAWPTPCRAGSTGPRPTARSTWPRSRAARTSPTPTSGTSSPTSCAAPSRCSRPFTPTSPKTRRDCATRSNAGPALNRAATRRWLRGEATREATHELLASTLEHVLRTFGAPATPSGRTSAP